MVKRTKKKITKSNKNIYYNKIMDVMMRKIDQRTLTKNDKKLFKTLLDNLHEICKIYTVKNN
jgi:hypothetical protein